MTNTFHHHFTKLHKHIKKHHKKYLMGIFGSFAVIKLFLLVAGLSVVEYHVSTFAQLATGCQFTGQYFTGAYATGGYLTGQQLTGGSYVNCTTGGGYRTGGSLDESGVLTGQTRVDEFQTGCQLTGQILTGGFITGTYQTGGYRTGGTVVCTQQQNTGADTQAPILTGISLYSVSGSVSGYVNASGSVILSFTSNESLTGLRVTLGSGNLAVSSNISGLQYSYVWNLTGSYPEDFLAAKILFSDIAGNTGNIIFTGSLIFDKTTPVVTGFVFSGYVSGLYLNFSGSEPVGYTFTYRKAGSVFLSGSTTGYLTSQQINFSGTLVNQLYSFNIHVFDRAGNASTFTGDFIQTSLGAVTRHISMVSANTVTVTGDDSGTGELSSLAVILKAEVEKFNACKDALSYVSVQLNVNNTLFMLQMPTFKKSEVKTLVNAFTLYILDKVKNNKNLNSDEITEITKKFDNFLIILKLLRDDDNVCKQNLSNYHISQFKDALQEYNLEL